MKERNEEREIYLYHNTEVLLKRYRDVIWSVEVSLNSVKSKFENQFECDLETFLELSYAAGADLTGTQIQEQMRTLERNRKMLKIIELAVQALRKKQEDGELFYWILYYTYLSERPCKTVDDILNRVGEKTEMMSWRTYFKRRKKAIEVLSGILWGYTAKECLPILDEFV